MSDSREHIRIGAEIDRIGLSSDPFAAAMRATRIPMLITDPNLPDNPIVFVNDAFTRLTGYAREEILNRNCRFLQGADTVQSDIDKIRQAIAHRIAVEIEILNYKKDGEPFWNRLLISPVFEADGRLGYFFASQYNTSVQHAAESALREKSLEFEALADNVSQLAWMAEPNGHVYWFNRRWYEYTGTDPESMRGLGWRHVYPRDEVQRIMAGLSGHWASGKPFEDVYHLRSASGEYRPFLTRVEPILNQVGELVRWFGTNTDISHQYQAEQRLSALIRSSSEVRYSLNADWSELYQLTGGDFIADTSTKNRNWFEEYIPAEDREAVRAEIDEAIRTKSAYLSEHRVNRVDGTIGWALSRAVPLQDANGEITGWFGAASDITDRKLAELALRESEARLREANDTLEQRVASELTERTAVEEQLRQSQKLEAVGQLTGGVAHDFNNLLTVIKSSTDLLKRPGLSEERRDRYIAAISDTVERAATLTGQLLAFARRQELKPEVFDAAESVRRIGGMMRTLTGSRIRIVNELPDAPCHVNADMSQFDTALVNMAVNARDAMDGEGQLTIAVRAAGRMPRIRAHAAQENDFVAVSVSDTGSGIAPDRLAHIFEPFFTTKEVGKGTGLGLSQVFGFAKQSGGDVDVQSVVGRGTTFTLYLPQVRDAVVSSGFVDSDTFLSPLGHGQAVLVVEDNIEVGQTTQQLLQDLGFETELEPSGEAALRRIRAEPGRFQAVFSDVVMPGMGGIEFAKALRAGFPHLPVVLTSGYSHVLSRGNDHGFELIQKPYSAEQVGRVLRRLIGPLGMSAPGQGRI